MQIINATGTGFRETFEQPLEYHKVLHIREPMGRVESLRMGGRVKAAICKNERCVYDTNSHSGTTIYRETLAKEKFDKFDESDSIQIKTNAMAISTSVFYLNLLSSVLF